MGKRKFFDILLKEYLNKYSNLKYLSQKIAHLAIMYSSMYMERINDFNIYTVFPRIVSVETIFPQKLFFFEFGLMYCDLW